MANSPGAKRSNLTLRILSSLVLGPLILAAVYVGQWEFAVIVGLLGVLGADEWLRLVLRRPAPGWARASAAIAVVAVTIATGCAGAV
ncbi:phosphatidate cytidylyltransferase, partial [Inquilinus limosus]|uniref:phosphatidate cytidylyltransferase n=1 Tax=Inquilinus limosus TaxID=171674 RepID=UPI0013779B62